MTAPNTNLFVSKWFCFINIYRITCGFYITHTADDVVVTWLMVIFIYRIIITIRIFICINTIRIYTIDIMVRLFIFNLEYPNAFNRTIINNYFIFIRFISSRESTNDLSYSRILFSFCLRFWV